LILKKPTRVLQLPPLEDAIRNPEAHLIPTREGTLISGLKSNETEHAPAINPQPTVLSDETVLMYVLAHSGCVGHLTAGRVERVGLSQLKVYDQYGAVFEYVSGANLRSWCVFGPDGNPIDGWSQIHPQDAQRFGSLYLNRED